MPSSETRLPAGPADRPVVAVWRERLLPPSETFVLNQAQALQDHQPVLVGLRRERESLPLEGLRTVSACGRHLPNRMFRGRPDLRRPVRRLLRDPRTRLVHAHFLTDALAVLPAVRRAGLPLVVTCHGNDVTRDAAALDHGRPENRMRELADYASHFVCVSDFIAERTRALGVAESKTIVLPIGIPVGPAPVADDHPREGILFVGRLVAKKACGDLLAAVRALPDGLRSTPVTVIGDGPERRRLEEEAVAAGLQVRFLGTRSPAEVATAMRRAQVLCNPSRTAPDGDAEGFGMIFLEAAAQELPVVSYRSGGIPEAVLQGVSGLLADEGDVRGLVHDLEVLLTDDATARRLGTNGRTRVVEQFDISARTRDLEQLYASLSSTTPVPDGTAQPAGRR